jgi:hypothetical protein
VTAPAATKPSDFEIAAAHNVANARKAIAGTDCGTREMNSHLSDIATFDELVKLGALIASGGHLELHLSLGGLRDAGFDGMPVHRVRAALKAYAEWLELVAANAY